MGIFSVMVPSLSPASFALPLFSAVAVFVSLHRCGVCAHSVCSSVCVLNISFSFSTKINPIAQHFRVAIVILVFS